LSGQSERYGLKSNATSGTEECSQEPEPVVGTISSVHKRLVKAEGKPERELGEWNTTTVVCRGTNYSVRQNGREVLRLQAISDEPGRIGLRAQGIEMEFRTFEVRRPSSEQ
jgi:hypothetical protein